MTDRQITFFQPMPIRDVTRSLPPALAWAYASLAMGAVLLAAVGLISFLALGSLWLFDRSREVADPMWSAVITAAWVAGPVAIGAAVWGAAYASTTHRSVPRSLIGLLGGTGVGAGLLAMGASGFAIAALAVGWGVAIPAHNLGRVAFRALVPVAIAVGLIGWTWGSIESYRPWQLAVLIIVSPPIAALWVWLADAIWMAARAARSPAEPT